MDEQRVAQEFKASLERTNALMRELQLMGLKLELSIGYEVEGKKDRARIKCKVAKIVYL